MKLTDGLPPSQMGMLGLSAMPKTPPKPVPSRNMPDYGLSLDSRAGALEKNKGPTDTPRTSRESSYFSYSASFTLAQLVAGGRPELFKSASLNFAP